jgi:hypothetical protein
MFLKKILGVYFPYELLQNKVLFFLFLYPHFLDHQAPQRSMSSFMNIAQFHPDAKSGQPFMCRTFFSLVVAKKLFFEATFYTRYANGAFRFYVCR